MHSWLGLNWQFWHLPLIVLGLSLTDCSARAPHGQVIAVVNNEDVTLSDLDLEFAGLNIPPEDRKQATPEVLREIIRRRLFAQNAVKTGIGADPTIVLQIRRAREVILAQAALQKALASPVLQPIQSDLEAYVRSHEEIGVGRRLLVIDQLRFQTPNAVVISRLKSAKTLGDIVEILKGEGVTPLRTRSDVDTAAVSADILAKVKLLRSDKPLVDSDGANMVASAIIDSRPSPLGEIQAEKIARRRLSSEGVEDAAKRAEFALRSAATITYAPGYGNVR